MRRRFVPVWLTGALALGLVCFASLSPLLAQSSGKSPAGPPAEPLDLNRATFEELQQLPEVGPATARAILRFREKSGPFRRVEELLAIRGITPRRLERIRPHVFVKTDGEPAQSAANAKAAPA